jgi:hypothetical protein
MKFAIQHNLMNIDQLHDVAKAVKPYPHIFVGTIPFSQEITSDEPLDGIDYIPYGSTLLTNLAAELGWLGLHFDLSKLNYRTFLENRGDMLNDTVISVKYAIEYLKTVSQNQKFFTRPSEDLKQYSGQVLEAYEIWSWLQSMVDAGAGGGSYYMSADKEIVLSIPKDISAEWRWFIVGGQIISGSMYRAHGQSRKVRELDHAVIDEAQSLANVWLPDQCVVMDTALVGDEIKVIEFNTINSSGFYDNDVDAVFKALWEYHN